MRILMVHPGPEFSVADVFNGWKHAFEKLGHDVGVYNTNDRLSFYSQVQIPDFKVDPNPDGSRPFRMAMTREDAVSAAVQGLTHELFMSWPHLVFFVSAFFIPAWLMDVMRQRRLRIVILHTESPYQDDEQLMRAQYAHVNLINDPLNLEEYAHLAPAMYMPHAYDPSVHYPGTGKRDIDFSFIGTIFESRRIFFEKFFQAADAYKLAENGKFKVAMGGCGWDGKHLDESPMLRFLGHLRDHSVDNKETAGIYRRSKTGINFYRRESEDNHAGEGWAMGPREVELAACGVPFMRDSRPESDEVFGDILKSFSTPEEAAELLHWYLANEDKATELGREAREAIEDRTFDNHAKTLMKELERARLI